MPIPKTKTRRTSPYYLNVVGSTIRANRRKLNSDLSARLDEPITSRSTRHGSPQYGHAVDILDASGKPVASLVYRPDRPLGCGAVVYVVCNHGVRVKRTHPPSPKPKRQVCRQNLSQ